MGRWANESLFGFGSNCQICKRLDYRCSPVDGTGMVFISGTCCTRARTSLLAMFQPLGQITLGNAYSTASWSLIDYVPAQDEMWKSIQASPYGTSMPESAVKGMGGRTPGGLSFGFSASVIKVSHVKGRWIHCPVCVCVCVLVCRGTCKCRLMRHTQLDTHTCSVVPCPLFCLQQNVCCVRLWAVNTHLPSLNNWLYIVALKWNIPRCWF